MVEMTRSAFLRYAATYIAGAAAAPFVLQAGVAQAFSKDKTGDKPRGGGQMKQYSMVVLTNAVTGREDEYNDWYSNRHIHDVVKVPGFVSAQRFKIPDEAGMEDAKYKYGAIYGLETDDVPASLTELMRRNGTPDMAATDAMDQELYFAIYEAITPKVEA